MAVAELLNLVIVLIIGVFVLIAWFMPHFTYMMGIVFIVMLVLAVLTVEAFVRVGWI